MSLNSSFLNTTYYYHLEDESNNSICLQHRQISKLSSFKIHSLLPVTENSESTGETIESNIIYQQQRLTRIMGTVT